MWVECFGVPKESLDLSIKAKERGILGKHCGVISEGYAGKGPGKQERPFHKDYWGSLIKNLVLLVTRA